MFPLSFVSFVGDAHLMAADVEHVIWSMLPGMATGHVDPAIGDLAGGDEL